MSLRTLSLLVFFTTLAAQTPDSATLQIRVTDPAHAPIADVELKVVSSLSGTTRVVRTNSAGSATVAGLPVAPSYQVSATKSGFAEAKPRSLNLSAYVGKTVTIRLTGTEDSSLATSFLVDDTSLTTA